MIFNATLVGHIGRIDIKTMSNGNPMLILSVSHSTRRKINNEWQSDTTWVRAVVFGGSNSESYFSKFNVGDLIALCGEVTTEKFTTLEGVEKTSLSLTANEIKLLSSKGNPAPKVDAEEESLIADDIPF